VGGHERIKCERSVEPTWVRQDPRRSPSNFCRLSAPGDVGRIRHRQETSLPEKRYRPRRVAPDLALEFGSRPSKLFRPDLVCSPGRPADYNGDPAFIIEEAPFLFRLQTHIGEAGKIKQAPKAIARI